MVETSLGMIDKNACRPHVAPRDVFVSFYGCAKPTNIETAAVSRAFRRLIARGLLVARHRFENSRYRRKYPSGYDLTEHGLQEAERLSVKSCQPVRNS
jgi:DNA-binding transcriptional MocR family regulator